MFQMKVIGFNEPYSLAEAPIFCTTNSLWEIS